MSPLGSYIVRARERLGWDRRQLAVKADIPYTTLRNIELNDQTVKTREEVLQRLAVALGVPFDELRVDICPRAPYTESAAGAPGFSLSPCAPAATHEARGMIPTKFDSNIQRWATLDAFLAFLRTVPRPAWCIGLTIHNTYIPNEQQWRGLASMRSMQQGYIAKGWSAGPHLFLAADCTTVSDAGIWQMTPLDRVGVHAGPCNSARLGIENVADWNARPPTVSQKALLYGVIKGFIRAWQIETSEIRVHNECMPGRTCPGKFMTGEQLRHEISQVQPKRCRVAGLLVYQQQNLQGPIALELPSGTLVDIDVTYPNGAGHLKDGSGFVDMKRLERL